MTSDLTARKAINNVITREALINCDFSGNVLDGVDQAEVYIRDAYILRDMRKDYNLFNSQLGDSGNRKGDIYQVSAERKDNFGYCRRSGNYL